jgi:cytosine/adenosine deaminase-related metal-dependent hydrolase
VSAAPAVSLAVSFVNADIGGHRTSLRLQGQRILGAGLAPQGGDRIVDLKGDRLLPGLINAHDHLQLNDFPQLPYASSYRNAGEWIADFNARLRNHAAVTASAALPRARRLLGGGLKNLLSGVTTVAHHDPLEPLLLAADFPTGVVADFGWAHSLQVDGAPHVRASCAATAGDRPWIIHAAEGVDASARGEFERLRELGCLRPNTLLVHALALDDMQQRELADAGAGIIWCPSSNLRLFGRTTDVQPLLARGRVALGTDSRLTAAGDLLQELRVAQRCAGLTEDALERIVTSDSARLLRLEDRGRLERGARADLLILPAGMPLTAARRSDLRLVMLGGEARYGDHEYLHALDAPASFSAVEVDGRAKLLQRSLAALLLSGAMAEPGVSVPALARSAACA